MIRWTHLIVLGFLTASGGCDASRLPTTPHDSPTLAGSIVALDLQFGAMHGTRNIHVQPEDAECGIVFAVDRDTRVVIRGSSGDLRRGSRDDLTIGANVRAWARGVILESCPGQTSAATVEVLQ